MLVCEQPLPSRVRRGSPNFLLQSLVRTGHEVTVICPRPKDGGELAGVRFMYVPLSFNQFSLFSRLRVMRAMVRMVSLELRRGRYDIIRTIGVIPSYAAISGANPGIPIMGNVTDLPTGLYGEYGFPLKSLAIPMLKRMERAVARRLDCAEVETPLARRKWEELGLPARKVSVLPTGVDSSIFSPNLGRDREVRDRLGAGSKSLILWHGDFVEGEGLEILISATAKLGQEYRLVVAGGGNAAYTEKLRTLSLQSGSTSVAFTGWVDYEGLPSILGASDLGAYPFQPTKANSQLVIPQKIKEMIVMKKPIVTTRTEGIGYYLGGIPTYIDSPEDLDEVTDRIRSARNRTLGPQEVRLVSSIGHRLSWDYILSIDGRLMRALASGNLSNAAEYDWAVQPN